MIVLVIIVKKLIIINVVIIIMFLWKKIFKYVMKRLINIKFNVKVWILLILFEYLMFIFIMFLY